MQAAQIPAFSLHVCPVRYPVQPVAMLTTEGPSAELDSGPALLPTASCQLGSRFSLVSWNVN